MCGIAGVFQRRAPHDIARMLSKLTHRGPDGQGIQDLPYGTLGHRRLAIIDVEGGHQPMCVDDAWIVFNGEIYNFQQLARDYLADDDLKTRSDTEVILHLYRKFGPRCTELLDGMFAFAIIDGNELFLARDPLGIKPLYCGTRSNALYFASEIKALVEVTDDIREFPAGHWFHSRTGWHSYFDLDALQKNIDADMQASEAIKTILKEAVSKRLLADVPVGISLSGGLDSSIVALLANQEIDHLHSFAVGMAGSEDLVAARKMAAILGTEHHECIYTEQAMLDVLPRVIYHLESFDPALVRSAIPNFFLAEMAAEYVKVILTGEGADEIYAGYDYLARITHPSSLQKEMVDMTAALHNTNLQRADRIPMAFGLEARVPFLDVKSVAFGLGLSPEHKIHQGRPAKYLLRQAFRSDLPEEIVNRPKQKFSKGAGSSNIIRITAEHEVSDSQFQIERDRLQKRWDFHLANKEALYYYLILRKFFKDGCVLPVMGQSRSL